VVNGGFPKTRYFSDSLCSVLVLLEVIQGVLFSCFGLFETSPFTCVSVVICAVYNGKIVHPVICRLLLYLVVGNGTWKV
jgi:hypothetical protein